MRPRSIFGHLFDSRPLSTRLGELSAPFSEVDGPLLIPVLTQFVTRRRLGRQVERALGLCPKSGERGGDVGRCGCFRRCAPSRRVWSRQKGRRILCHGALIDRYGLEDDEQVGWIDREAAVVSLLR
jgi:hypothetical protein